MKPTLPPPGPEPPEPAVPAGSQASSGRARRERSGDEAPWPVWTAPASIVAGLGLGVLTSAVVGVFARLGGSSLSHPTTAVSLIADVAFDLSFVAAALYFGASAGGLRPAAFGFRRTGVRRAAGGVLAGGAAYYVISAIYASALGLHGHDKLPSELGVNKSTAALVSAAVFVCVIAPIAEELFFRGFLFGGLRRWRLTLAGWDLGPWVAAVLTGALFGLAHTGSASAQYLIPLGFLGFVLCLVRWRTRSLYPCIALHSINNSLALGVNQLHWNWLGILGLVAAGVAVCASVTLPLARPALAG